MNNLTPKQLAQQEFILLGQLCSVSGLLNHLVGNGKIKREQTKRVILMLQDELYYEKKLITDAQKFRKDLKALTKACKSSLPVEY